MEDLHAVILPLELSQPIWVHAATKATHLMKMRQKPTLPLLEENIRDGYPRIARKLRAAPWWQKKRSCSTISQHVSGDSLSLA